MLQLTCIFNVLRFSVEFFHFQLAARKRHQQSSLDKLCVEKGELREGAAQLSERYEDIKDNAERLTSRIQRVLQIIQVSSAAAAAAGI